jgi:hypothetical protein
MDRRQANARSKRNGSFFYSFHFDGVLRPLTEFPNDVKNRTVSLAVAERPGRITTANGTNVCNLLRVKAQKKDDHNRKIIKRSQIQSPMAKTVSGCERFTDLPDDRLRNILAKGAKFSDILL